MTITNKKNITAVIMCGGQGVRLWPISNDSKPKTFLNFGKKNSFFQEAVLQISNLKNLNNIVCITNFRYRFLVSRQLEELNLSINSTIITEPVVKNTSPAILATCLFIKKFLTDSNVIFLSADYLVSSKKAFKDILNKAIRQITNENIVLLGNKITKKSQDFGYIHYHNKDVISFIEKPDFDSMSKIFRNKNNYLVNMGFFIGYVDSFINSFKNFSPLLFKKITTQIKYIKCDDIFYKNIKIFHLPRAYKNNNAISFDHDVLQKHPNLNVLKYDHNWKDYGDYISYIKLIGNSFNNVLSNISRKLILNFQSKDLALFSSFHDKKYIVAGLKSIIIIDTPIGLLIIDKSLINSFHMSKKNKEFILKNQIDETFEERPWGNFKVISSNKKYKIKIITVYPDRKLSLQKHQKRYELWTVLKGKGEVFNGKNTVTLKQNDSYYVERNKLHQLINPDSKNNLVIIESQFGDKISESDIIRVSDPYGRKNSINRIVG